MFRVLLFACAAAGCAHTVTSTATPATAKLTCLDCDARAAVGLPIRAVASWVGSCTKSGYTSDITEDKDTGKIHIEHNPFSETKDCNEHRYKLEVECTTKCVVKSQASEDSQNILLLSIYPQQAGPLHFKVVMHREGEAPVAEIARDVLVRQPDAISTDEKSRVFDSSTPEAVFDGVIYELKPPTRFNKDFPLRGVRYSPSPPPDDAPPPPPPDLITKTCRARAPASADWHPCDVGVHEGDDVRIDITTTTQGGEAINDFATLESASPDTVPWTCYRFDGPGETCVRYGIPAGAHVVHGTGKEYQFDLAFQAAPPPSVAVTQTAEPVTVTIDSKKAFDSRRTVGDVLGLFEGEYVGIRDLKILSGFVVIAATVSPTWGRLRVGLGDGEFIDKQVHELNQKRLFRATLGWEKQLCFADRHMCAGLAVDGGYSFYDQIEGFYAVPQAIVDVRGDGLMFRFGVGETYVLGTFDHPGQKALEHGLTFRLSFGFPHDF